MPTCRILAICAAAVLAGGPAALAQSAGSGAWTVALTPAFVSQYMFRGMLYGGASFQPQIEADAGGAALGIWCSSSDREFDPYASYTQPLNPRLSLEPGFTVYYLPIANTAEGNFRSSIEPNVAVNWTVGPVRLSPKIYYDVASRGTTGELNAAAAIPLASIGSEIDLGGTVGAFDQHNAVNHPPDGAVSQDGGYWLVQAAVPYQFGHWKATVSFAYTAAFSTRQWIRGVPGSDAIPDAASRGVLGLSLAYTF